MVNFEGKSSQLAGLIKLLTQDAELINAYAKHSLNKELDGHCIKGWHPLKKGLSF